MTPRAKTILVVLIAITLAGVGYFFIKPKSEILPPVNTVPPTEEIDTSDWQTYYSGPKGFEIKMPKDIGADDPQIGSQPNLEDEFWREQVGGVRFLKNQVGFPQFRIRIKDSDLSLEEFARKVGTVSLGDDISIGNLPSKRYKNDKTRTVEGRYHSEDILIKRGQRYYYFEFLSGYASSSRIDADIMNWNKIISTFKLLD